MKDLMMRAAERFNTSERTKNSPGDDEQPDERKRLHQSALALEKDVCRLRALSLMIGASLEELGGAPKGGNIHAGLEFLLNDTCDRIEAITAEVFVVANLDSLKQLTGSR